VKRGKWPLERLNADLKGFYRPADRHFGVALFIFVFFSFIETFFFFGSTWPRRINVKRSATVRWRRFLFLYFPDFLFLY